MKIAAWENLYLDWLSNAAPSSVHVLHFEDLSADAAGSVTAVNRFLGFGGPDPVRLKCAIEHSEGKFHRRKNEDDFDPFTPEMKTMILKAIDRLDAALRETGKKPLPRHKYQYLN